LDESTDATGNGVLDDEEADEVDDSDTIVLDEVDEDE